MVKHSSKHQSHKYTFPKLQWIPFLSIKNTLCTHILPLIEASTLFKYNIAAKNLINKKKRHNNIIVQANHLSLFIIKMKQNKKNATSDLVHNLQLTTAKLLNKDHHEKAHKST
jgi:hypothetical protein